MLVKDTPEIAAEIEEAVKFLVHNIDESGHNPKPVIFHSIKVGFRLYQDGYSKDVVVAGLLHDLLEDSGATSDEIKKKFGDRVADLVKAATFNKDISDEKERYLDTYGRCEKLGKDAIVIKAADILDNSYYYRFAKDRELYKWLLFDKLKHFVENSEKFIGKERVWMDLKKKYLALIKKK